MLKYIGTVNMLMNDTVDIDAEVKRLKRSAKVARKMEILFDHQVVILADQREIALQQIALLKEQKKIVAKLGKIK